MFFVIFLLLSYFVEILKMLCNVNHQPIIKDLYPIVSREREKVEKKSDGIQDLHLDREKKKRELVCFE
jgi:hypothetical protein